MKTKHIFVIPFYLQTESDFFENPEGLVSEAKSITECFALAAGFAKLSEEEKKGGPIHDTGF